MKINKDYFKYLFLSKKIAWAFCLGMYMAASLSGYLTTTSDAIYNFADALDVSSILSIAMAIILPVVLFSFVHRKRSCDQYFSLPVRRKDLLFTILAFSFTLTIGFFLITNIVSLLMLTIIWHVPFQLTGLIVPFIYFALGCAALLVINSAIYLIANNIFDGIVILAAYAAIPLLIYVTMATINNSLLISFLNNYVSSGLLFSPVVIVGSNFYPLIQWTKENGIYVFQNANLSTIQNLFLILYTLFACFLLKKHFINRKTERAEQISNDFLSYPFIINFYLLLCLLNLAFSIRNGFLDGYIILYILLFFIYIVAIFIYKRKLGFYWKNALYFLISTILSIGVCQIIYSTKAFGLPYLYPVHSADTIYYDYTAYNLDDQLNIKNYDNSESKNNAYVNFTLSIPTSKTNDPEYQKAFSILENYRTKAINDWYEGNDGMNGNATFGISNEENLSTHKINESNTKITNFMNYYTNNILSVDDLKIINQLTPVTITINDENYEEPEKDYTLSEYLKEMK